MPMKACARAGCRALVPVGTVYCGAHDAEYRRERAARADAARAGRADRRWYKSAEWRRRRAAQLAGEPLCRMCEAAGRVVPATVADHVVPHRGDAALFWGGELQSLCKACHDGAKQRAERRGAAAGG